VIHTDVETQPGSEISRRERRKLEVRGRILDASRALFEGRGIDATTVVEICERADVAQKTFFNHFSSKRDLLRVIAEYSVGQLLADIEAARKQPLPTRDRIRHFFETLAANAEEAGPMHRELISEVVRAAHESDQARKLHDAFGSLVLDGRAHGDVIGRDEAETQTEMLMGAFYVLMFNWAHLEDYPLRARALATADFLVNSITVPTEEA
jgi:AcrR family transcriptional regulator